MLCAQFNFGRTTFTRAGEAIGSIEGLGSLLQAPPISVLLEQQEVVETRNSASEGVKKSSCINQSLFSLSCAISPNGPVVLPLDINVNLDNPTAFPVRTLVSLKAFQPLPSPSYAVSTSGMNGVVETRGNSIDRPTKRPKVDMHVNSNGGGGSASAFANMDDVMVEATRLAELLSIAIESKSEE